MRARVCVCVTITQSLVRVLCVACMCVCVCEYVCVGTALLSGENHLVPGARTERTSQYDIDCSRR